MCQAISALTAFSRAFIGIPSIFALVVAFAIGAPATANANPKYAGIVIDAKNGNVLYEANADAQRYPASLTKMMTLYLVFDALDSGRITKSTQIPISNKAASEVPSKLGLKPGQKITVEAAIYVLVTKSANDVATAVGEFLGGSEAGFARMMTDKARQLGMSSTTFKNAHGLPDSAQKTTARDMARLGIALREHHPRYYGYFSTRAYSYGSTRYGNHNKLLGNVNGVDGIKTGYIRASGFNLVSSLNDGQRSIVAVVMGGRTGQSRDAHMRDLIRRYLSSASTGPGRNLVARANPGGGTMAMVPGERVPRPSSRPETATAYVSEEMPTETGSASGATTRPAEAFEKIEAEDAADAVDEVRTGSTEKPEGWVIQVGSMPSEDAAEAFLESTETKAATLLADATGFTEEYVSDGRTYYRARYGGFAGKSDAWDACASLKQKDVACYAVKR